MRLHKWCEELIIKRSSLLQAHLSKIADFLRPGPGVWWKWREDASVEFVDAQGKSNSKEQGPQLHPFRSNNFSKICWYLEETWEDLSVRPDQLYLYKMRDKNGKLTLMLEREQIWRIASASGNRRSTAIPWWTPWIWWRHTVRKYKKHRQIHWTSNFWRSTRSQYF